MVQTFSTLLSYVGMEKIILHTYFLVSSPSVASLCPPTIRLQMSILYFGNFPSFRSTKPPSHHGISSLWKSARLPHKKPRANRASEACPLHFSDLQGTADMASLSLVCSFF